MSRTKEFMINNMNESDMNHILAGQIFDLEYQRWLESSDYINMVNEEAERTLPIYSQYDVTHALQYAKSCMTLDVSEIGRDIYFELFNEKIFEFLNKEYER